MKIYNNHGNMEVIDERAYVEAGVVAAADHQ